MNKLVCLLWPLGAVLAAALAASFYTCGVEHPAHYGVSETDVLHATATEKHDRVFLEVVTDAWNVCGDFHTVGKSNTSDLSDCGVRLLRGLGSNLDAYASLERREEISRLVGKNVEALGERNGLRLSLEGLAAPLHELANGWHSY